MATPTTSVADHHDIGWRFENTYACLPDVFFAPARPAKFPEPGLTILNHRLGTELGLALDELSPDAAANLFAGQDLPVGVTPIAQAYAGISSEALPCSVTVGPSLSENIGHRRIDSWTCI